MGRHGLGHTIVTLIAVFTVLGGLARLVDSVAEDKLGAAEGEGTPVTKKAAKPDAEWKAALTPEQYKVMRCGGTEAPFSGKYTFNKEKGVYACAACGQELFPSDAKFESGTGWPSFFKPIDDGKVGEKKDDSHGMVRTEVVCTGCGAHLGHVFDDGPEPTGLRYCINSVSLDFREDAVEQ